MECRLRFTPFQGVSDGDYLALLREVLLPFHRMFLMEAGRCKRQRGNYYQTVLPLPARFPGCLPARLPQLPPPNDNAVEWNLPSATLLGPLLEIQDTTTVSNVESPRDVHDGELRARTSRGRSGAAMGRSLISASALIVVDTDPLLSKHAPYYHKLLRTPLLTLSLPCPQLVEIGVLNKATRADAKFEMRRRIDRQLEHFRLDPSAVFKAMEKHGALISGSVALASMFPDEETFFGGEIDFYVNANSLAQFVSDIRASSQYEVVSNRPVAGTRTPPNTPVAGSRSPSLPDQRDELYPCVYATRIVWLQDKKGEERTMTVVETFHEEPFRIVSTFYSTLLMNAITHLGVVCFYPELTMARVGVVKHSVLTIQQRIRDNVLKYGARGFKITFGWNCPEIQNAIGKHVCGQHRCCPWTVRDTRADSSMLWMAYRECVGVSRKEVVPAMRWSQYVVHELWEEEGSSLTCQRCRTGPAEDSSD
ncbi:hypothetical protein NMY22_g8229 [Coprinellus aureogranulatus]|nr:hypothetical protein NMY22_g8229 [Coprinellus aureogranulatus]